MSVDLIIVGALLVAGFVPLAILFRSTTARACLLMLAAAGAAAAWLWQRELVEREQYRSALLEKSPREGRPGGYAGSSACRSCHPAEFKTWHDSFHRSMTQYPDRENVRGNFDNVTLHFDGDTYHLQKDRHGYWVDMVDPDWKYAQTLKWVAFREGRQASPPEPTANPPRARKPITLMTGSHHMQTYWVPSGFGNLQFNLPFTYVFESQRWAPRHDVFLLDPDKHYSPQLWNTVCLNCHATAGQPRQDPKTKTLDSQAAEMGISCEACHGPAEEHVRANSMPARRYAVHGRKQGDPTIFNPGRANPLKASETCGQCHAIRRKLDSQSWLAEGLQFNAGDDLEKVAPLVRYEDPNAPGTPDRKRTVMEGSFWSDGQVRVSGRDFNGLAESPCHQRGQLSCLSCHSMHSYQSNSNQLAPRMESNDACLQCHKGFAASLEAHTHHPASSAGSLCYNCHMPHTSYGLLKAIRSHTITSPDTMSTLDSGRPNACNLCHLDRTLGWAAARLHEWYRQPVPPMREEQTNASLAAILLLRGDAGQRAVVAWHAGWSAAVQASGHDWLAPYLAELLSDPYSVVRYVAERSLRRLPGYGDLAYNHVAPPEDRRKAADRAREIWNRRAPAAARPDTLVRPDGTLDEPRFRALLQLRNDRRMELLE